jgi:uncharacterized protein (TIGR02466 family)
MLVKLNADVSVMFGTPILVRTRLLGHLINSQLEKVVLARAAAEQSVQVSNVGGWQSRADFFDWHEPEIAKLGTEVNWAVQQFVSVVRPSTGGASNDQKDLKLWKAGWANINRPGDYNILHNHPGQDLAAVYYVKAARPDKPAGSGGHLELRDPRPVAGFCNFPKLFSAEPLQITPEPGMLVVFPAWVEHMVHPHHGSEDRISIAINIKLMDFDG